MRLLDPWAGLPHLSFGDARKGNVSVVKLTNIRSRLGTMKTRIKPPPKVADSFYNSPEWRLLVRDIKRERGNWCECCGADGRKVRMIGDHTIEIKDGGAKLDADNVKLLCATKCHPRKTALARQARARGEAGVPVDIKKHMSEQKAAR